MSLNRSITESQKPPNSDERFSSVATLPSMKSKMLASVMMTPAHMKDPSAERHGGGHVDEHAREGEHVRVDAQPDAQRDDQAQRLPDGGADESGECHGLLRATSCRRGRRTVRRQAGESSPAGASGSRTRIRIIVTRGSLRPRASLVPDGHHRPQGPDRTAARAARCLPVLQPGWRDHLRGEGPPAARPRPELPRRPRQPSQDRCPPRRGPRARSHRHRLGGRGAGAREQPHQAAGAALQRAAA